MISQLSQRDRLALAVGGVVVLAALIWAGVISPYQGALERLDARIASRQTQMKDVEALRQEFLQLQRQLSEADRRLAASSSFSLFSFVEGLAIRVASKENLIQMRPQPPVTQEDIREESVEIRLEKVRLEQLVRLLHELQKAEAVLQVKSLRLKTRFDDRSLLDAVVTIASYGRT